MVDVILFLQGMYYLITALWSFIHLKSFTDVVGPKPDIFQLHTTSLLILVISLSLLLAIGKKKTLPIISLSIGTATAFMLIEIFFAGKIRPIFWLDFIAELAIVFGMMIGLIRRSRKFSSPN